VVAKKGAESTKESAVRGIEHEMLALTEDEKFVKLQDYPE